jgi:hypothetical protein
MTPGTVCSESRLPFEFMMASAIIERAELPVQRNRMLQ